MKRFITRINGTGDITLKQKQDEISDAALKNHWQDMALYIYNNTRERPDVQFARFDGIIAGISQGDIVAVQLPTGNGHLWEQRLISHVKAYGGKVIIYLHRPTYESVNGTDSIGDTVFTCNYQETLIAESFEMIDDLDENGLDSHVNVFVRENSSGLLDPVYYISKVLDLAFESALTNNKGYYQLARRDIYREKSLCQFSYFVARVSYNENHGISYKYEGDADGIIISANGKVVWETNDLRSHYALIEPKDMWETYTISAYVYTLKGRMIVASTEGFTTSEPIYHSHKPKISLIVPAYNSENIIVRTIDTVLGQSQDDIELVVVDDGSSDNTPNVVNWYAKRYESVQMLRQTNGGQACARNTGIDFAHGQYIAFMDHDDMLPVNALKSLYNTILSTGADVSVGKVQANVSNFIVPTIQYNYEVNTLISMETFLGQHSPVVIWNKLYKSELCKKHKFGPRYHEDIAWTPIVLSYADTVAYTDELVYEWDRTGETLSLQYDKMWSREKNFDLLCQAFRYALENCNPGRLDLVKDVMLRSEVLIANPEWKDKVSEIIESYHKS